MITLNQLVKQFINENKSLFIVYCICILALPINDVLLPHFYGKFISSLQTNQSIKLLIITIIGLIIIVQIFLFINDLIDVILYPKLHRFIRQVCLDHIIKIRSTDLKEVEIGKIIAKLVRLPNLIYNYIEDWRNNIIPSFIIYLCIIIYFLQIDWQLALILAVMTIVIITFTIKALKACNGDSKMRDQYHNKIFEEIDEILRNLISVIGNNSYQYEVKRLDEHQKCYDRLSINTFWCSNKYKFMFMAIFIFLIILFVLRCKNLYKNKKLKLAAVISILIIMLFLTNTTMKHTSSFKEVMIRYGTISEALELFRENENNENDKQINHEIINTKNCLILSHVNYTRNTKLILNDISFDINCGDNVAFVGEIGSGKSSLFRLIMKHNKLQGGSEIYLNGFPYSKLNENYVRTKIGMTQQTPLLFNRSLLENIGYGNFNSTENDIINLINKLELTSFFDRFPDKLQTLAGKYGSNLSGGEKQIIMILRVLLHNPDIILMDEPTSALDSNTRDTVFNILIKLIKEKTVLAITHDEQLLKYFNRVITLDKGSIISDIKNNSHH